MAEYRIAFSSITAVALNASNAYLIEQFPLQSDQVSIYVIPWGPPKDEGTTYPAYQRYTVMQDRGTQRADGFVEFNWCLSYLTEGMVNYINAQAFPSSAQQSVCTVKTLTEDGSFHIYSCNVLKPRPPGTNGSGDFKRGYAGVEDYVLRFVGGTLLL